MSLLTAYSGLLMRMGLYLLIFWPTVGYYVYSDSEKKELSNPRLRGLVLGFLGYSFTWVSDSGRPDTYQPSKPTLLLIRYLLHLD
jgi:hypothetical protein